jgi:hypothetical protein
MFSCSPEDIDPSKSLTDIAAEIMSLRKELQETWNEYVDVAYLSGLVDTQKTPEEQFDDLDATIAEVANYGARSIMKIQSDKHTWLDRYALPVRIQYKKSGEIERTLVSGETHITKSQDVLPDAS